MKVMTELAEPPLSRAEAKRRMPTLRLIDDDELRHDVAGLTRFAPAYFWTRPGSTAGYHNAHEHGLWAHTLKLSTVIERLADSYVERGLIRDADVDRAHAAAILHDQRKEGRAGDGTASDHDLQMATGVRQHVGDEIVARCVASHMGAWYDGPDPQSPLEELVHVADMVASDDNCICKLQEPIPEELQRLGFEGVSLR